MNVDDRVAGVLPPSRLAWRGLSTAIVAWVVSLVGLGLMTALGQGMHVGPSTSITRKGSELASVASTARTVELRGEAVAVVTSGHRAAVLNLGVRPFAAASATVVYVDAEPLPRDAELALLWVRKTNPGVIQEQRLNEERGVVRPTLLDRNPEWRGEIASVALGIKRAATVPVVIRQVRLEAGSPRAAAADLWRGWMSYHEWDGRSINVNFGGREEQRLYLLPLSFAAAALAAGFILLRARYRREPASRAWLVVPFALSWLLLDARWQAHLVHQARDTHALFGGKSLAERHLLMDDAALYRFIEDNRSKLPAEPARIFVTSDLEYFRLRGGYHLYPHNVLAFDWADPSILRPGDFLLLFQKADVRYDVGHGELIWPDEQRLRVEALAAAPGQGLFRVR